MRCDNCSIPIPEQPENATYDMLLCDSCLNALELYEVCPQCLGHDIHCLYCNGLAFVSSVSVCEWKRQN